MIQAPGQTLTFQEVEYKDHTGKVKKSKLLLSGFWGLARHMNYVFEMMLATSWSLPGTNLIKLFTAVIYAYFY